MGRLICRCVPESEVDKVSSPGQASSPPRLLAIPKELDHDAIRMLSGPARRLARAAKPEGGAVHAQSGEGPAAQRAVDLRGERRVLARIPARKLDLQPAAAGEQRRGEQVLLVP